VYDYLILGSPQQTTSSSKQEMRAIYRYHIMDISSFYELVGASDLGVAKVKLLQISFPFSQHQMISHFH
jgi:hypothetical protein